jgi:hypothetical protein
MKLTNEQTDKLNGFYDTASCHFGGDAVLKVEEKYFKEDKLGYLNWLEKATNKIEKSNYTLKIVGKRITEWYK